MEIKICIGLPTNRGIKPKTAQSLLEMISQSPYDFHIVVSTKGYNTAENRNYITAQAMRANCTHLLLLDDDMIYEPDGLVKLVKSGKEIIGGAGKVRNLEQEDKNMVVEYLDGQEKTDKEFSETQDIFKVNAIGGCLLLIDLSIIPKLKTPLFWYKVHDIGMVEMSNDWWFCERAREAGYDIWCDPTIKLGHIGDYEY